MLFITSIMPTICTADSDNPNERQKEELTYYGPEEESMNAAKLDKEDGMAKPTPQQLMFLDLELGLFIHFGLSTYTGQVSGDGKQPASMFNPSDLDCEEWMEVAKTMGARYAVLTARHEGGFCNWQTKTTDYCVKNSPWRNGEGDVVREFVDASRKYGIKVGLYHTASHDAHHRQFLSAEEYGSVQVEQITELMTNYGPIDYLWFDHHSGDKLWRSVDDRVRQLQPDCVIFGIDSWISGGHSGRATYPLWYAVNTTDGTSYSRPINSSGQPDGMFFRAWEANSSVKGNWFCGPRGKSVNAMIDMYYKSVGRGANLLLNFAPEKNGKMGADVLNCAQQFAEIINKRFSVPLAETQGSGRHVELDLGRTALIDHVIIEEDLTSGQRIADYTIDMLDGSRWLEVAGDLTVGHKKIDRLEPPVRARKIRFHCGHLPAGVKMEDVNIRKFAAYGE